MSQSVKPDRGIVAERRILDAAYSQVMRVGVRRTTLVDVAERAGLGRSTVYRRFPDVTAVLQALMFREFGFVLEQARTAAAGAANERDRVVAAAIGGVELLTTHELFLRLLDVDPELLLPYMTHRTGRFQRAVAEALAEALREADADGSVRGDDPRRMAEAMVLAMHGYAFSARAEWTRAQRRAALEDLARMLDGLLRPEPA